MKELFKRIGAMALIFVAGGIAFMNLSQMRYGFPVHYQGSWIKVGIACSIAVFFGIYIIKKD